MSLPKYKEIDKLTTVVEIDQEIFILQKSLFDLRIKKSTSQTVKTHLFTHAKRRIAHLKFKKAILLKATN